MKLSPYTLAKNCSDISDVEAGLKELKTIMSRNRIDKVVYLRYFKLQDLKDRFNQKTTIA